MAKPSITELEARINAQQEEIALQQEQIGSLLTISETILEAIKTNRQLGETIQEDLQAIRGLLETPRGGTSIPNRAATGGRLTPFQEASRDVPRIGEAFGRGTCADHNYVHLNKHGQCVECINQATKALYEQRRAVTA